MKKSIWLVSVLFGSWLIMASGMNLAWAKGDHYQLAMGNIINSYLKIREKLAADSLKGVAAETQKIIQQAHMAEKMHTEHPKHSHDIHQQYQLITEAGKHAAHLSHGDIKTIRHHFLNLSKPIIKYVEKFGPPHNLSGELFTYYCPMYPGYWVQDSKDVANPLYGKSMLKCGELVVGTEKKQKMLHEIEKERQQKHKMEKEHHMEGMEHKHM